MNKFTYTETDRNSTPVLLLVGGRGERLRSVLPSTPKPLAPIGNTPFLRLLVMQLKSQGFRHFVMCTGHLADQVSEEFRDGKEWDAIIEYSREATPLGTAGAVKLAGRMLPDVSDFVVMNGDSFLEVDFNELVGLHSQKGGLVTMAARGVPDAARYGTLDLGVSNRVMGFREKTGARDPGIINGGVYVFNRAILEQIPEGASSLERDIFPAVLDQGIYALEQHGMFIDIGTPEDYSRAQQLCTRLFHAACGDSSEKRDLMETTPSANTQSKKPRAVFLDRDGVINRKPREGEYVTGWDDFHFLPDIELSITLLRQAGFRIIVVTNQRCVAKGLISGADLEEMHMRMCSVLARKGAAIDAVYYCPHELEDGCACRKPAPGMLVKASEVADIDLSSSWMVGDSEVDIEAGRRAGCKTVRIGASSGYPSDVTAGTLLDGVGQILLQEGIRVDSVTKTSVTV